VELKLIKDVYSNRRIEERNKRGDLDKVAKIIFSITKDGKEILMLGKPLFARVKESKAEVNSGLPFKKDK